jgi:hypothetical protein
LRSNTIGLLSYLYKFVTVPASYFLPIYNVFLVTVTDSIEEVSVDPREKGGHIGSWGAQPARRGKRLAVGFRQRRGRDIARWLRAWETGSPHLQETVMHRVSAIVHCTAVIQYNNNRNCVSLYYLFRKINHFVPVAICIHPLVYGKLCQAQLLYYASVRKKEQITEK